MIALIRACSFARTVAIRLAGRGRAEYRPKITQGDCRDQRVDLQNDG
jgi:hypothetical protein